MLVRARGKHCTCGLKIDTWGSKLSCYATSAVDNSAFAIHKMTPLHVQSLGTFGSQMRCLAKLTNCDVWSGGEFMPHHNLGGVIRQSHTRKVGRGGDRRREGGHPGSKASCSPLVCRQQVQLRRPSVIGWLPSEICIAVARQRVCCDSSIGAARHTFLHASKHKMKQCQWLETQKHCDKGCTSVVKFELAYSVRLPDRPSRPLLAAS